MLIRADSGLHSNRQINKQDRLFVSSDYMHIIMSQFKQNVRMQLPEATMVIMPFIKEAMDWWMANIPLKPMTSVQL